jgi:acyl-CoA synthetase (AMP-forming)/AMP-acid ligase II
LINIGNLLTQRARITPDREAYVGVLEGTRLTFRDLNARSNQAAALLRSLNVRRGDRVAVMLPNGAELLELHFALAKLGAIHVPINWRLAPEEIDAILKDSGSTTMVFAADYAEAIHAVWSREEAAPIGQWLYVGSRAPTSGPPARDYLVERDRMPATEPVHEGRGGDVLFIMYTSGTTGVPKGVVHTHETCFWSVLTFAATHDLRDDDRYLASLPMFHVGSLTPVVVNVYRGATSVVLRSFDAGTAWRVIEEEQVTTALLVPAMLNFMLQSPERSRAARARLRWIQVGAAPVAVSLIEEYQKLGIDLHQIYGMTETCGPACLIDREHALRKVGSTGRAFFHTEVKVVDAEGRTCPPHVLGEIWIRAPHIMVGYWNQPQATRQALVDGWLRTGDGAEMDEEGYVYIRDRLKDMLITGGENVYPAEVENVLMKHPDVVEAAVIGQPSARWGESVFAVVVRRTDGLTEAELLRHCEAHLARYKRPCGIAFVERLPRTPSGKILKRELRTRYPGPAPV